MPTCTCVKKPEKMPLNQNCARIPENKIQIQLMDGKQEQRQHQTKVCTKEVRIKIRLLFSKTDWGQSGGRG